MLGRAVVAAMIAAALTAVVPGGDAPRAEAAECADAPTAAALDAFFAADGAGGLSGADYPHAVALPDGRTLWLFQDAFIGDDGRLWQDGFAHNVALVQSGTCFQLLPTSGGPGTSWIGSWVEEQLGHWFWPLDAEVGRDGHLWVFLADVRNPNGTGAASGAVPAGTWRARFRLPDLELIDLEQATDSSSSLFGYSIVSDDDWTYLYGHCYRQFSPEAELGFEPACSPYAYLARVPKGRLDRPLSYWSGDGWTFERADRAPVLTGTVSMPVSVERFGDVYVAASDEGDWFGADVVVRTADAPEGPWTEVLRYTPETRCGTACNNYGAFVLPRLEDGRVVIAHSNNAWDMAGFAFDDASLYRIDVTAVDVPGIPPPPPPPVPTTVAEPVERDELRTIAEAEGWQARAPAVTAAAPQPATPPATEPDGATSWLEHLAVALAIVALALAGVVAALATLGFVTLVSRADRARRQRAVTRLRTDGAARAHRAPMVREPDRSERVTSPP